MGAEAQAESQTPCPWHKPAADGEISAMEPLTAGLAAPPPVVVKPDTDADAGARAKVTAVRDSTASLDSATLLQINADSRTNSGTADSLRNTSDADEDQSSPADSAETGTSAGTAAAARATTGAETRAPAAKGKERGVKGKPDGVAADGKPAAAASSGSAGSGGLLSSLLCCAGGGAAGTGARDDSPDRAAERIRASTAPEEQRRRAAAAARAALLAGRTNVLQNGHTVAGASKVTGSTQRRQKEPDRGSPTRGEDAKAGTSHGDRRGRSRGRAAILAEATAAGAKANGKSAAAKAPRSRGDPASAAVVDVPGSRVPDVVVDRQTRTSNRYSLRTKYSLNAIVSSPVDVFTDQHGVLSTISGSVQ